MQSDVQPSTPSQKIQLSLSWLSHLETELKKIYMLELKAFLQAELSAKKRICPKPQLFFEALNQTSFEQTKVVILGQDPYHGPGQAHGLSFSVPAGVACPPSLRNIYKELESDLQIAAPKHGCLLRWASQGVLLLNATLSVEEGRAGSHQNRGWEEFTDRIVSLLNEKKRNLAFLLWGSYAQKKGAFIDNKKHLILKSAHPSPLSSHRGFFGSKPFSQINSYLLKHQIEPIDWSLD